MRRIVTSIAGPSDHRAARVGGTFGLVSASLFFLVVEILRKGTAMVQQKTSGAKGWHDD